MAPRKKRTVEENAKVVSEAFAQIVRFSLNEPFRKKCFQVLQVEGSFDLQNEINEKLMKSLQPATYSGTQSSGYDSQHSQPNLLTQTNRHTSVIPSQPSQDEERIASQKEMFNNSQKSSQPTIFCGYQSANGSQYSETDASIKITQNPYNTCPQPLQAQCIIQNSELSQLSTTTQEEKDLEEAMVWGEDSDSDHVKQN